MAIIQAEANERPVPSSKVRRTQITYCDTIADRDAISGGERYAGRHVFVNEKARIYVWDPVVNGGAGAWCCPNGMIWSVTNAADRPAYPRAGTACWRIDLATFEQWNGAAWRVFGPAPTFNPVAFTTPNINIATVAMTQDQVVSSTIATANIVNPNAFPINVRLLSKIQASFGVTTGSLTSRYLQCETLVDTGGGTLVLNDAMSLMAADATIYFVQHSSDGPNLDVVVPASTTVVMRAQMRVTLRGGAATVVAGGNVFARAELGYPQA